MRLQNPLRLDRRHFLLSGAAAVSGLATSVPAAAQLRHHARQCILLNLVGGPSHLDTFDPKPNAPAEVRGPFRPIRTSVPGIQVSELLPHLASQMHEVALVRSVFHEEAPIHETGQQLVQTGRLAEPGTEVPHIGQHLTRGRLPIVPGPIENTGVCISHGQPKQAEVSLPKFSAKELDPYGDTLFGRSCLQARCLVEAGQPFVIVNAFTTVFDEATWDCHADGGSLNTTLEDLRRVVAPAFDRAYATLLRELRERGLLEQTLVVASGEFGRTPRINRRGGRDHWPGCWTALFAGGGVVGGHVIGRSDRTGATPVERPVHAAELAATMMYALGAGSLPGEAQPIWELFA